MKKILTILLVLVLALTGMVSCDMLPDFGLSNEDLGLPSLGGKDDETAPTLEDAKSYLFNIYKDANAAPKNDYDVVALVKVDGVSFDVTWKVSVDSITVKKSTKDGFYTVDLPSKNDADVAYVLTATIKDADGKTIDVAFNKTLPVIDATGIVAKPVEGTAYKFFMEQANLGLTLFATNKDEQDHKYISMTLDPKAAADYFVEVVGEGYKIYTKADDGSKLYVHAKLVEKSDGKFSKYIGLAASTDCVFVYNETINALVVELPAGTAKVKYAVGTYNAFETIGISEESYFSAENTGVSQFPACFMESSYAETLTPDERPVADDPADGSTLTIQQAIALGETKIKDQYTTNKYYVTGVITEITNDTYGNMYIADSNGNSILVYGTYSADGKTRYDDLDVKPVVGDTVTVYGVIGMFNAAQLKNAWITSHTAAGGGNTPVVPSVELEVVDPVVGTAYKFGMVQGKLNDGKVYFLNGLLDGNSIYMTTTTDATKAVDVYLEAADNGYYLYAIVGEAKQYINFVSVTGTDGKEHINAKYEAAPSTVYTYNTEKKTVTTLIDGEEYWLGTRNDKTYTTVGPVKVSYNGFYNQFYGEAVAHEHSYEAVVTAPTCTEAGYTTHTCECGDSYTDTPVDALGHNYENGVCTGCGLAEAHTHKHEAVVTAPTCTEAGYTTYTCACGDSYTADPVDALGHTEGAAATCEAAQTCTVCGAEIAPKLDHTYVDGACSACGAKDPDYYFEMTIAEALAAADDTKVIVSGTVCAINTAWSDSYGNISVTITDADGNTLYLYRLKANVALGDIITAKGTMATYNSNRQMAQGGTAEITGHDSSYDYAQMTIAEAIKVADNTNVIVTGTVVKINTAYSEQYGNISVTIADENGNQLYLYRLTGNVALNDVIQVKGAMATYNGSRQVAGGTFEKVGTHTCSTYTDATCGAAAACVVCGATTGEPTGLHTYADATCTAPKTCTECGATEGEPADHTYVNGVCSVCGKEEGAAEPVVETLATFTFGDNGSASHVDGSDLGASTSYTEGNYTLSLTGMSKVFGPAYDATGNSCIKLGTSKVVGTFSFTVDENVTEVIIYVAGYKANSTNINVNGEAYTVTSASNNGEYTAIVVDTTTTKTVTFTTVSGGVRCMIDSIVFNGYAQ